MDIKYCPSCGGSRIKKTRGTVTRTHEGKRYSVSGVTYFACPDCGERVYDRQAVRKIQAKSPAYGREFTQR